MHFHLWNGIDIIQIHPFSIAIERGCVLLPSNLISFLFHQKIEHFDADTILILILFVLNIFWIFVHCLMGKLVTSGFDQLPNHLFHSRWYQSPIELQKYSILLLANTQKSLRFHGFKTYVLDLETFARVSIEVRMDWVQQIVVFRSIHFFQTMNRVYSYYMMFRGIEFKWIYRLIYPHRPLMNIGITKRMVSMIIETF